jgi:hydroxymethylglutaryl-CoA lyase
MRNECVTVCEVGLRDGLQSIATVVPTRDKLRLLKGLVDAGVSEIEVGSFVPPRLLPQMADTPEVVAHVRNLPGVQVTALVPNRKGAELAFASGVHKIIIPPSASQMHSRANVRKTPDEMIAEVVEIVALRQALATCRTLVHVGIGTAFGCAIQGDVPEAEVIRLASAAVDAGADSVGLGDTVGYANPEQVRRVVRAVQDRVGAKLTSCHFHDTRGLALANVVAALDCGIREFDSSLGGLGGCPFAPGATGNVATEDLVFMLNAMGFATGINVGRLIELRQTVLAEALPGEALSGSVHRAGLPKTYAEPRPIAA